MALFFLQSIALCLIFTLMLVIGIRRDPLNSIMSYPPAVRERVASLPQYRDRLSKASRRHLGRKAIAAAGIAVVFAVVLYLSGQRSFIEAFPYAFGLFLVGNLYDLLVLDWVWFCHSKKVRIPGTEDMPEAYRDKVFHLKAFFRGLIAGVGVALISAGLVEVVMKLLA
jgi:hypothetical protein